MLEWIEQNPFGQRPGWSSGYETAHRLIGWAWTLTLIWDDLSSEEFARIWNSYALQVEYVKAMPSLHSSANNHRIVELTGLLAASTLGATLPTNELWSELELQAKRQTYPDGGTREQASGYFLYVLEALWVAAFMRKAAGDPLDSLGERLLAMLDWLGATRDSTGEPPQFGDDAEDRAIRLHYFAPRQATDLDARVRELLDINHSAPAVRTRLLRDSGLLVIRDTQVGEDTTIFMDVGELGYGSLAAHGHADALSILAKTGDQVLLRDSGTGTYVPADGRDQFRMTAAHNTVTINGESQAVPVGPHVWADRYRVVIESFDSCAEGTYLRASHNGYERLAERAKHARSVTFLSEPGVLLVLDRIIGESAIAATLVWQLSPGGYPGQLSGEGGSFLVMGLPTPVSVRRDGRFSPRYGQVLSAPRYMWSATAPDVVFATLISLPSASTRSTLIDISSLGDETRVVLDLNGHRQIISEDWSSDQRRAT